MNEAITVIRCAATMFRMSDELGRADILEDAAYELARLRELEALVREWQDAEDAVADEPFNRAKRLDATRRAYKARLAVLDWGEE